MTLGASRVTLARQRAGLSKSALAHKAGTTPRTVTTWESTGPPSSRLHQIATITGMPPKFFSTKEIDLLDEKQVFFRARRRSPSVLLRRSTAFGALGVEFYRSISKHFRTPALSLIDTEFRNSPQEAAMALRLAWGMGLGPAPNLCRWLRLTASESSGFHWRTSKWMHSVSGQRRDAPSSSCPVSRQRSVHVSI